MDEIYYRSQIKMGLWRTEIWEEAAENTLQEEYVGLNFRDIEEPLSYIRPSYLFRIKKGIHYRI